MVKVQPKRGCQSRLHLQRTTTAAQRRYQRRVAMVDWFHAYWRAMWERHPHTGGRISLAVAQGVASLASAPRRKTHIYFEDCLHLEDQAALLLIRLDHHPLLRHGVDIRSIKTT